MSGPCADGARRARLLPWLALTTGAGAALVVWVNTQEVEELTLDVIPDRYAQVVTEPTPASRRQSKKAEAREKAAVLRKSYMRLSLRGTSGRAETELDRLRRDVRGIDQASVIPTEPPVHDPTRPECFEGESFVDTSKDPRSTFSVDVDTASWSRAVGFAEHERRIPASEVRVEEFLNAFRYGYDPPAGDDLFAVHTQVAPSPWSDGQHLLRIGLQARALPEHERPEVHLTFLIDTSCSMDRQDKLPVVRDSLHRLVDELRPTDTVAMVTYAGRSEVVLEPTPRGTGRDLHTAIDRLDTYGGTAMADGVYTAYQLASRDLDEAPRWAGLRLPFASPPPVPVHRVVLVSDGDANIGPSDPDGILPLIREHAQRGVTLTTIGVGRTSFRDDMMERLADEGDGAYHFIRGSWDANRVFGTELVGTLHVVARDAKVQVAFDPDVVRRYRLVGYDNRRLLDRDFADDTVDAGEIGSGHQVTALYEVELSDPSRSLGEVRLRAKPPGPDAPSREVVATMVPCNVPSLAQASPSMQTAVAVAELARVLRREEGFLAEQLSDPSDLPAVDPSRRDELTQLWRSLRRP